VCGVGAEQVGCRRALFPFGAIPSVVFVALTDRTFSTKGTGQNIVIQSTAPRALSSLRTIPSSVVTFLTDLTDDLTPPAS
jgi:outer membrane receptor protein involved in Fe transport